MKNGRRGSSGEARRRRGRSAVAGPARRRAGTSPGSRRAAWKWRTPKSALAPLFIFGHA
ncbi:MAG TPA: hypothetical protein VEJ18_20915 [Planctomycetota bacterium]|nr:hypothetical protein [Planctomycetota bacterium]